MFYLLKGDASPFYNCWKILKVEIFGVSDIPSGIFEYRVSDFACSSPYPQEDLLSDADAFIALQV